MKRNVIGICLFIIFLITGFTGCIENNNKNHNWTPLYDIHYSIEVIEIIDGDTIKALMPSGRIELIRFLGIDTPEVIEEKNNPNEYDSINNLSCLNYYGHIATNFTRNHLLSNNCSIWFDRDASFKDYFDRWLCYVVIDNHNDFNSLLLEEGLARVYINENFSQKEFYINIEKNAIIQGKGLWSCRD